MKKLPSHGYKYDVAIIGGCGHVGLPLGISFALQDLKVCLIDTNLTAVRKVNDGSMPFIDQGADLALKQVRESGRLIATGTLSDSTDAKFIVIALGTPVDRHMSPDLEPLSALFRDLKEIIHPDQCIVLRSTLHPGACQFLAKQLGRPLSEVKLSYCPERIAQGKGLMEIKALPQIVSGLTKEALAEAAALFSIIAPKIIVLEVAEAELAKLFTNSYRYIQFAIANQFYMIAEKHRTDFYKIRQAMMDGYERAISLPKAGLAAGPCLLKDTIQLGAFSDNDFALGQAARQVNEGLPHFIVDQCLQGIDLSTKTVGILGMSFKPNSDDIRDSLSVKLKKILQFRGAHVLCTDAYIKSEHFLPLADLLEQSDIVLLAVPHDQYLDLEFDDDQLVIDPWGIYARK